ncbi:MAG: cytochrome c biogenesis protein CcdA [Actinomycetota bacterium]|nr:cytochrome c biogenesis protein CcdA [Actinomycetota bacterium]
MKRALGSFDSKIEVKNQMTNIQFSLQNALSSSSPLAYLTVFALGAVVSLGSCVILELPLLMGFLGGVQTRSKRRLVLLTLLFVGGMLTTYLAIGLAIGLASLSLAKFASFSRAIFYGLGAVSLLFGLYLLGFIHPPKMNTGFLELFARGHKDYLGAYLLGAIFIFFEAPTCPCCAPALILISGYMVTSGTIISGLTLLMVYVLGQSVPILIAGVAFGWIKGLSDRFVRLQEYLQIVSGILLTLVTLDLFWLA